MNVDKSIRFAGICDKDGEMKGTGMRENVPSLLSPDEVKMSLYHATLRWKTRKALSHRIGKEKYSITEYEKIKRITIPLNDNELLLVSADPDSDHDKIIKNIFKSIQTH